MFAAFFKSRSKKAKRQPVLPDFLAGLRFNTQALPCEVWTEFGMPHLAEVKLERPSALAVFVVEKARA